MGRLDVKEYNAINELVDCTKMIKNCLQDSIWNFVVAGYFLKQIRDKELYKASGFGSLSEYAKEEFGFKSKSVITRLCQMNDKFSLNGNSQQIDPKFQKFNKSQLQEMLYLNDDQMELARPDMTVKEIREIRKPDSEEEKENNILQQMYERPDDIPGQATIEEWDDGAYLPENVGLVIKEAIFYVFENTSIKENYLPAIIRSIKNGCIVSMAYFSGEGIFIHDKFSFEVLPTYCEIVNNSRKYEVSYRELTIYIKELYVDDLVATHDVIVAAVEQQNIYVDDFNEKNDISEEKNRLSSKEKMIINDLINLENKILAEMQSYWEEHNQNTLLKHTLIKRALEELLGREE